MNATYTIVSIFYLVALLVVSFICKYFSNETSNIDGSGFAVKNTTAYRGLFAILIVLHHFSVSTFYGERFWYFTPFYQIGSYVVAGFFMFSGYGLTIKTLKQGLAPQRKTFLYTRLRKIIPLFFFLFVLACGYRVIFMGQSVVEQLSCYPKYNDILWYSWFVIALLCMYTFYWIAMLITKNVKLHTFYVLILSFVYCYIFKTYLNLWPWWYVSTYAFSFGIILALNQKLIALKLQYWGGAIITTLIIFIISFYGLSRANIAVISSICDVFTQNLIFLSLIPVVYYINIGRIKVLQFLGTISFELYLTHGFFIQTAELLQLPLTTALPFVLAFTILTSNIIYKAKINQPWSFKRLLWE